MKLNNKIKNQLYYGDNLTIMQEMPDESIDLIYLDPPFNSNRNYNLMYKTLTGQPVDEQVEAFCDTWSLDAEKQELIHEMPLIMKIGGIDNNFIEFWMSLITALKSIDRKLLAYLVYMSVRLVEMRRLLKPTGSIYLHCDPTASHYIKIMLDGIFGKSNFRNEVVWSYSGNSKPKTQFPRKHDILLMYSKHKKAYFNPIILPYKESTLKRYNHVDEDGKRYKISALRDGKQEKVYMSEGVFCTDVFSDIPVERSKDRIGYPTQKPIKLLQRIIKASCPEGGIVFDPFCGCGTTIAASYLEDRNWIGADIAVLSVKTIQKVLKERYGLIDNKHYQTNGIPTSTEGAKILFNKNPFQFEHWAIELVGGFINNKQRGDGGIDGKIYFYDDRGKLKNMILSVKGGKNIGVSMVRELRGTLEKEEKAELAGLILLTPPTPAMLQESEDSGLYKYNIYTKKRLQILTIEDIINNKRKFDIPNPIGQIDVRQYDKSVFLPFE